MDSENKTHISNDSEVKLSDKDADSEESKKAQSSSLKGPSISRNVDSVTSENSVVLKDASHIVEVDNLACGTMQNEANEPMEFSVEDEIKITTDKCDKTKDMLKEILCATNVNSVDLSEATTSQDNSPSSSYTNETNALNTDQNKVKRSISKGQLHAGSGGTSIEKSDDSSDEDSSKRQKLNKSARSTSAGNVSDDTVTFQRNKSKAKQRNYRKRRNITNDNEDSSGNTLSNEVTREASIPDADEGNCLFYYAQF